MARAVDLRHMCIFATTMSPRA